MQEKESELEYSLRREEENKKVIISVLIGIIIIVVIVLFVLSIVYLNKEENIPSNLTGNETGINDTGDNLPGTNATGINGTIPGTNQTANKTTTDGKSSEENGAVNPPITCIANCAGKQCGDDGCGGSCGSCDDGYLCNENYQCEKGDAWYVRPGSGEYGLENGINYETAWDGFGKINWSLIKPGDTLYICGKHIYGTDYNIRELPIVISSGNPEDRVIIDGNCPGDQGIIIGARKISPSAWTILGNNTYGIYWDWGTGGLWQGDPIENPELLEPVNDMAAIIEKEGSWYDDANKNITNIVLTGSNPVMVTCNGHGFVSGQKIRLHLIVGINGNPTLDQNWPIDVVDENTFTLRGSSSSNYSGSFVSGVANTNYLYLHPKGTLDEVYTNWVGGLFLMDSSFVTVKNLKLYGGAGNDGVLRLAKTGSGTKDTTDIIVKNTEMAFGTYTGIYASGHDVSNVLIENCTIHDVPSGSYTISFGVHQFSDWTMRNIEVYSGNMQKWNISEPWDSHALGGQALRNWIVENCSIHDWAGDGILDYATGYDYDDNVIIRYNTIKNLNDINHVNHHFGIALHGTNAPNWAERNANWQIYGNIISNLGTGPQGDAVGDGAAIRLKGPGGSDEQRPKIYNNVFYDTSSCLFWGGFTQDNGTALDYKNNICYLPKNGAYHVNSITAYGYKNIEISNNIWYPDTQNGNYTFRWYRLNAKNLSDFITIARADGQIIENNLAANPLFVEPENGDFHLQAGSPAIDAGINVGLPYSGNAPDMGAYEYTS